MKNSNLFLAETEKMIIHFKYSDVKSIILVSKMQYLFRFYSLKKIFIV